MRIFNVKCTGQAADETKSMITFSVIKTDKKDQATTTITVHSTNPDMSDGFKSGEEFDITITPKKK